jgi:hypothetical protein
MKHKAGPHTRSNTQICPPWLPKVPGIVFALAVPVLILILAHQNKVLKVSIGRRFSCPVVAIEPGRKLPKATFQDVSGDAFATANLYSRGIGVLVFLTPTCQSCETSLETWEEVAAKLSGRAVGFDAILVGNKSDGKWYLDLHNKKLRMWLVPNVVEVIAFGIDEVPITILHVNGTVIETWRGTFDETDAAGLLRLIDAYAPTLGR